MTVCQTDDPIILIKMLYANGEETLEIGPDCPEERGAWWSSLQMPDWAYRYTYAPPSAYVPGNVLMSAVIDAGAVTMRVAVKGTTIADLEAEKAKVNAACAAWPGLIIVTADTGDGPSTIGGPWQSFPTVPSWGPTTPQMLGLLVAEATISLPVNPAGAP